MTMNAMQLRAQEYLDERRLLGCSLGIAGNMLLAFARFADHSGHKGPLTLQLIVDWAQGHERRHCALYSGRDRQTETIADCVRAKVL